MSGSVGGRDDAQSLLQFSLHPLSPGEEKRAAATARAVVNSEETKGFYHCLTWEGQSCATWAGPEESVS